MYITVINTYLCLPVYSYLHKEHTWGGFAFMYEVHLKINEISDYKKSVERFSDVMLAILHYRGMKGTVRRNMIWCINLSSGKTCLNSS